MAHTLHQWPRSDFRCDGKKKWILFLLFQMDCGDAQLKLNRIEREVIHCRTIFYSHHSVCSVVAVAVLSTWPSVKWTQRESNARKTLKHTNNNKSNNKSGKCLARRRTTYRRTPDVEMVEWFDHNTKYENERRKGMNEKLFCKRRRRTALRQRERRGEREREIHFAVTKR